LAKNQQKKKRVQEEKIGCPSILLAILLETRCRIWKFWKKKNSKSTFFFKTWRLETHYKHSFSAFLKENSPPKNKQNTHETGDLRTIKCQILCNM
jgi:hypothetical protein